MSKYPVLELIALVFIFFSCQGPSFEHQDSVEDSMEEPARLDSISYVQADKELEPVELVDIEGNRERYYRRKSDRSKSGHYTKYDSKDQLIEEAFYIDDTLHLYRIFYYETGDTQIVESLNMGVYDGAFKAFYENGQLELLGNYENNVATGQWKKYYSTGELMEIVTFADNKENGPFIEYFQNGNLKAEGNYKDGSKEHGLLRLYNDQGVLIRKMNCKNGICKTIWKAKKQNT